MSCPVEIKPSSITNAGNGVFTTRKIAKGEYLTQYSGRIVRHDMTNSEYSQRLPDGRILVGDPHSQDPHLAGQLINDANMIEFDDVESLRQNTLRYIQESPEKANTCMEWNPELQTLFAVATRKIKKGEELFCSYGISYWLKRPLQDAVNMRMLETAIDLENTLLSFLPLEQSKQKAPPGGWPTPIRRLPPMIEYKDQALIVPADNDREPTLDECCRALVWAGINPAQVPDPYAVLLEAMRPESN